MSLVSDSAKKTVSITPKKAPLNGANSADKTAIKQLSGRRSVTRTVSETDVVRRQKTKK